LFRSTGLALHGKNLAEFWVGGGGTVAHVDKDAVRCILRGWYFSAGTRGLNDKTVESAFGINCGDLTLSGDGLAVNRGGGTSALDVRNRDDLIRGSFTRGVAGFASAFDVTGWVIRGRCASGEGRGVGVGVGVV